MRANAVQRQVQKESVEIGVVGDPVAEDDRDVAVEAFRRPALLDRNEGRHRERKVIHRLFAPFPRTPFPGLAQVGKQAPPTRAATSLVGALRDARGSLLFATWTSPPPSIETGADCPDKAR